MLPTPEVYIEKHIIPIPISYKTLVEDFEGGDVSKLIDAKVSDKVKQELQDSQYLLLIDGVDEKNLSIDAQVEALTNLVHSIRETPKTRAVITSRYLKGLDQTNDLESEIARYELPPLSLNRTLEFLTTLCNRLNFAQRLIEDIKKSQLFKELPRSPIAAILLAKLLKENPKDLPSNMTELYSQYMELMLGRWDIEKGLQSQKEYQALDSIMMNLAKYALDYEMPYITIEDTRQIVKAYLAERNLGIDADSLLDKLTYRCEVVAIDPLNRSLGFKHRTFAEFFYAKSLTKSGFPNLNDRAFQFYWMNTTFFYIGLIKDCPDIIKGLISISPTTEAERWFKIINMSNYLLAGYSSPYNVIADGIMRIMLEAAHLFHDITIAVIDSPFGNFSHMNLLFLLQFLMRGSYSYDFFKNAIEEAALRIDQESGADDVIKAYALFFLNVAYIDLGTKADFDFLLKNHSSDLPIDLALAIEHESKHLKERTKLMRKQDRRVKHLLKGNAPLNSAIKTMYEQPIRLNPNKPSPPASK